MDAAVIEEALLRNDARALEAYVNQPAWFGAACRAVSVYCGSDLALAFPEQPPSTEETRLAALALRIRQRLGLIHVESRDHERVPDPSVDGALIDAWHAVEHGASAIELLEGVARQARAEAAPDVLVDATSLRALVALDGFDSAGVEEGLSFARRASRMARTEALPSPACLANLVLARARRMGGQAYLASHILAALRRFTPHPWHDWLAWEQVMAAGRRVDPEEPHAHSLRSLLSSSVAGDKAGVDGALSALSGVRPRFAKDVQVVVSALGVAGEHPAVAPWQRGEVEEVPLGLAGMARGADSEALAYVHATAQGARRILAPGVGLLGRDVARLVRGKRVQGRVDTTLAILALCGPDGLPEEELFRSAYGFKYTQDLHHNTFHVMLRRAADKLAEVGELVREEGRVAARLHKPVVLPDPRCVARVEDRVLDAAARLRAPSAGGIAGELGISKRLAQKALESLVAEGACARTRKGRAITYGVQDTTFHEPTQTQGATGV